MSLTREDVVAIVIDMAKRGSIPSYGQHSVPPQQPADINTRVEAAVQRALENRAQPVAQQPVSVQPAPVQAIDTGTLADMVASTLQKVLEKQAPKKGILQRLFGS